jgi:hypothetical protein
LAHYLELKSRLFDPDIEEESQAPLYDLALANGQLVATLNQTKASCLPVCAAIAVSAEREEPYTTILPPRIFMNAPAPRTFSMPPCARSSATAT